MEAQSSLSCACATATDQADHGLAGTTSSDPPPAFSWDELPTSSGFTSGAHHADREEGENEINAFAHADNLKTVVSGASLAHIQA